MGLFYFRAQVQSGQALEIVSIPVDGAFLFQVIAKAYRKPSVTKVSIPVDGAFLFQESRLRESIRRARCVSIPVDGAFLFQVYGGFPIADQDSICFNPRRWGFFISGLVYLVRNRS